MYNVYVTLKSQEERDWISRTHRSEVSHVQFIKVLDDWLEKHSELGRKYSENHPQFEDTRLVEMCPSHDTSLANRIIVCMSQN